MWQFRTSGLIGAALVLTAAGTAFAMVGDDYRSGATRACRASANGEDNETVFSTLWVDEAGKVIGTSAVWRPAAREDGGIDPDRPIFLHGGFEFQGGTPDQIGTLVKLQADVAIAPQAGQKLDDRAVKAMMAPYRFDFAYDDAKPAYMAMELEPLDPNWSTLRSLTVRLPLPPAKAEWLTIRLIDKAGRPFKQVSYRVGSEGGRQRLYEKAARSARQMATTPQKCWPIRR